MPQTTYLPVYRADYPILAKAQKPGGVIVLSAVTANDVPNKHVFAAGAPQMALFESDEEGRSVAEERPPRTQEEVEEAVLEEEDESDSPTNGRRRRRK